jgi:membrane protein
MNIKSIFSLFKDSFASWQKDNVPQKAAALSYYALFALAPLALLMVTVTSLLLGQQSAHSQIMSQLSNFLGVDGAKTVSQMILNTKTSGSLLASIIGFIMLIITAASFFEHLRQSFNEILDAQYGKEKGIGALFRKKLPPFIFLSILVLLLISSSLFSTILSLFTGTISSFISTPVYFIQTFNYVISVVMSIIFFGLVYRVLPAVRMGWKTILVGSTLTTVLFLMGRFLIGLYLTFTATTSVYGAAGSLVAIMLWIYYSSLIIFFGMEFIKIYSKFKNSQ